MDKTFLIENRDEFIQKNKQFIYSVTYNVCKRKLDWNNDDELSISLIAFNNACNTFKKDKGNFHSYAALLIKNSLIDYFRKSSKNPSLVFNSEEDNYDYVDIKSSLIKYAVERESLNRKDEIMSFSKELSLYKIKFSDLVDSSPSHKDTRDSLLTLAFTVSKNEEIMNTLKTKRSLPIKKIILLFNKKKKFLEKWRRYLIALIILLSKDNYPYIKSYLNIKVGDYDEL